MMMVMMMMMTMIIYLNLLSSKAMESASHPSLLCRDAIGHMQTLPAFIVVISDTRCGAKQSPLALATSRPKGQNQGGYGPFGPGTWFFAFFIIKTSIKEKSQRSSRYFKVRRFRICNRVFASSSSEARPAALKFGHGRHRAHKMTTMNAEVNCM